MDGWSVFTEKRMGTPITDEERATITAELREMEALYHNEEWIAQEIASNIELTGGWDRDLVIICLDHDINMLRRTLETGIVTEH